MLTCDSFHSTLAGRISRTCSARLVCIYSPPFEPIIRWVRILTYIPARNGTVIRADVHVGPDGRPKGSGIVVFESPDDARTAIQQFNGYDWQGRVIEVREDRYAGGGPGMGFGGRGGFGGGGMRGGFGQGFGGRGGFGGGRGGFGGGFGGRGGFGGGAPAGPGFEPPASSIPPNPFTDFATAGTDRGEIIYVRNVRLCPVFPNIMCLLTTVSCPGPPATMIWLSCSPPLERLSKLRSSTSRVVVPAVLAWFASTPPTPLRQPFLSSRVTNTAAVLLT